MQNIITTYHYEQLILIPVAPVSAITQLLLGQLGADIGAELYSNFVDAKRWRN
jgi:hypothetical protein